MLNTQLIASALPEAYDFMQFGCVSQIHIYLYRSLELRPPSELDPMDCWGDPALRGDRDFETTQECVPGRSTIFHVQRPSLKENQPLWFQIVAFAHFFSPNIFTTFTELGGGGTGPEDDAQVLRDLHDALLTFPEGWHCATKRDNEDPRTGFIKGNQIVQEVPEYVPAPSPETAPAPTS